MNETVTAFLERPTVYRLWHGRFVNSKKGPVRRNSASERPRGVLDVGCGATVD
jgi:hypothetical protein